MKSKIQMLLIVNCTHLHPIMQCAQEMASRGFQAVPLLMIILILLYFT